MKIVAVSDHFVRTEHYEACFAKYPEYELKTIFFGTEDRIEMRDIFHKIERNGPEAWPIPDELYEAIEDADVLMVHTCPVPASLIACGKKLRAIITNRGGLENIAVEEATKRGIPVLNNPAHNSNGVCELAIGLMITESRNVARAHMGLMQGNWRENFYNTGNVWELKGKTVGIVGFGNIGHLMAERLHVCFGCHVLVNDIYIDPEDEVLAKYPAIKVVDLPTLMRESDVVTLHARNENVILDREMLSLMQPHAFFINTARAHMVDYNALYELLRDRKIMGAAIEVHPVEPLPEDYPFLKLDNVTLTTHRGGDTINAYSDSPEMLVQDYARYRAGGKVRFFVNPEVGFGK
ncbi:MAG: 2-hydroxyacid dehydrogenase [Clostridia bacterium]|nr:2-hydroxyacid dehydrogenase [Clostridia bacterium]